MLHFVLDKFRFYFDGNNGIQENTGSVQQKAERNRKIVGVQHRESDNRLEVMNSK